MVVYKQGVNLHCAGPMALLTVLRVEITEAKRSSLNFLCIFLPNKGDKKVFATEHGAPGTVPYGDSASDNKYVVRVITIDEVNV